MIGNSVEDLKIEEEIMRGARSSKYIGLTLASSIKSIEDFGQGIEDFSFLKTKYTGQGKGAGRGQNLRLWNKIVVRK